MKKLLLKMSPVVLKRYLPFLFQSLQHKHPKPIIYRCTMSEDEFNEALKFLNNE